MDASSKDTTDPDLRTGGSPPAAADSAAAAQPAAAGETVPSEPADAGVADARATGDGAEVLEAIRRRVDGLDGLDPAEMVGPAAEIADALGRLIEEDDR